MVRRDQADSEAGRVRQQRAAAAYARGIVRFRWVVIACWIAATALGTWLLPSASANARTSLTQLVPPSSPALQAEARALQTFRLPLLVTTAVVVQNPHGLTPVTEADIVLHALAVDQQPLNERQPLPRDRILGALPLINIASFTPNETHRGTTAITYLYFSNATSSHEQTVLAERYAAHFRGRGGVRTYVTGLVPANEAQARHLTASLAAIEIATLLFVALVVAVAFRSVVAPALTLGVAAIAYLADIRVLGGMDRLLSAGLPAELDPVVVALLVGVLTDYSIFFYAGLREHVQTEPDTHAAVRRAISDNIAIVFVAGLTVAAGTAALTTAKMQIFSAFGPGLAITVTVGMLCAITLVPACMAVLGPALFWPAAGRPQGDPNHARSAPLVRRFTQRRIAGPALVICLLALGIAALPMRHLRLNVSVVSALPATDPVRVGADAVDAGFPAGITGPTEVLISGHNVAANRTALARFESALRTLPGVATVLGPADYPIPGAHGIFVARGGDAARVVVLFEGDPLQGPAIADLRTLRARVPALADQSGLQHAAVSVTGVTAIAAEVTAQTRQSLWLILPAALGVELVIIAAYLRALVAPVFLLAMSALTVGASLGLTTWVFQDHLHSGGLAFYVPFSVAALLVALGSDYNVFGVGSIWEEASRRPLRRAIRRALPRSTRAITTAGVTLAGSLALVAIVPLTPFREFAFAMAVGLIIDTVVVRSVLVPSVLVLVGGFSGWPGHRIRDRRRRFDRRPAGITDRKERQPS